MIISRTPHRVSFFGGGTDYPSFYRKHGGKTLGAAIDKYCYISLRKLPPYFHHKHRIVYSQIELISKFEEIDHPAVKATLQYLKHDENEGISIHHDGDVPARSGLGSSSAFTAGLINGIYAYRQSRISKAELTSTAITIEQDVIKENVGSQDQTFAAYGGLNRIEFLKNGQVVVTPIIMSSARLNQLQSNIMMFYTGRSRIASDIAKDQIENVGKNEATLKKMCDIVDEAYDILSTGDRNINEFGELLNVTWQHKKTLSNKISNGQTDEMYEKALQAGALGGKLCGAGNGGFMAFYVQEKDQKKVREALHDYLYIPIKFDFTGSSIVFYNSVY